MKKITFFLISGLMLCPYSSIGAGFSCDIEGKTHVEATICNSSDLSELDSQMSDAYFQLLNTAGVNKSVLKKAQRNWLKSREKRCFGKSELNTSPEQCLFQLYQSRISELLRHPLAGSDLPD